MNRPREADELKVNVSHDGAVSAEDARAWIFRDGYRDVDLHLVQLISSHELAPDVFTTVLRDVWRCRPEVTSLSRETWLDLFRVAGFTRDGVRARRPRLPRRLYRGATEDNKDGMSWTLNPAIAHDFAWHRQGPGRARTCMGGDGPT